LVLKSASHPLAGLPSQLAKSTSHTKPQLVPSHVATACGSTGHGAQAAPHVEALTSLAHAVPQRWKLESHVRPHAPLSQVARPLAVTGHAFLHAPQLSSDCARLTH